MEITEIKETVAETGRILLEKKLVARTWGNISARLDNNSFAITPSGLAYENLTAEDIPVYNMVEENWVGNRKPSSEKKIHGECYKTYEDVNFVIHTHQDFATAIGLVDVKNLNLTVEEKELLGEIRIASYGLPGTKKLKKGVEEALTAGSKVILMIHHGAVICGKDRDDAINKAEALEKVCKRAVEEKLGNIDELLKNESINQNNLSEVLSNFKYTKIICNPLMKKLAETNGFKAQTDDMSQMLGGTLKSVPCDEKKILQVLKKQDAVLVKGLGCIIKAEDPDDIGALELLLTKAGIAKLYTFACSKKIKLGSFDCWLMHIVYTKKYSKKKNGAEKPKSKEGWRILKFVLFSISAGVIEILSFTLLNELLHLQYWVSYLVALVLSVLWNFTFNRKFTFKAANNVPIAMLKVALFYAVFTPLTTLLEKYLTGINWNEYLVTLINMALNLTTEYVYDRYFVFRNSIDTNTKENK